MPDDMNLDEDAEETPTPPLVHDDIMHRLLDYQRQLREGVTPEQAAEHAASPVLVDYSALDAPAILEQVETVEVIDLAAVEEPAEDGAEEPTDTVPEVWSVSRITPEPTPTPSDASGDVALRIAKLEDTLSNIATSIGDLRAQFQNMAIAADERLAAIESMLADARTEAAAS